MARAAGLRPRREALVGNVVSLQAAGSPGKETNCPRILTIGSLTELKGHHDLFRSLGALAGEGLDFRLSVVGDGPRRPYLESLATELRIRDRIEFHGELEDLRKVFPQCQLMVHPSLMEGLSNAVLEAMASGLAVCATAVGATPDYIEDRITGFLVPPHSPSVLTQRLRELLQNPSLRSRLGRAAHEKVSANCSPSTVVAQYENCYQALLDRGPRSSQPGIRSPLHGAKVLMYHNLLERRRPGVPVAGHQTSVDAFRQQMLIVRNQVLDPKEVHEALAHSRRLPKGILLTFDDGAMGLLRASEILADLGLSGVAFICPGALESGLWFYRMADALARSQSKRLVWRGMHLSVETPDARAHAYRILYQNLSCELHGIRETSLDDLIQHLRPSGEASSEGLQILDEPGLKRAASNGSLYFANHTWSHPNLSALPEDQIHREIQLADDWLKNSGLPTLPWLAFPQGHYDSRVLKAVDEAGLVPFGAEVANSFREVFTRIGIYCMDSNLARFRLKLLLKPCC